MSKFEESRLLDYDYSEELEKTEMFLEVGSLDDIHRILDVFNKFVKERGKNPQKLTLKLLSRGNSYIISYIDNLHIVVEFHYVLINDHIVSCWYPTSQLVYYPLITKWFNKYFPNIPLEDSIYRLGNFCPEVFKNTS